MALSNKHWTHHFSKISIQHTDADEFSNLPLEKRNKLMDYLHSGETEANNAVTDGTHKDKKRTWERWITWLASVGWGDDPYITRLKRAQKVRMVGSFAISVRRGEHSPARHTDPLVSGTVSKANLESGNVLFGQQLPRPTSLHIWKNRSTSIKNNQGFQTIRSSRKTTEGCDSHAPKTPLHPKRRILKTYHRPDKRCILLCMQIMRILQGIRHKKNESNHHPKYQIQERKPSVEIRKTVPHSRLRIHHIHFTEKWDELRDRYPTQKFPSNSKPSPPLGINRHPCTKNTRHHHRFSRQHLLQPIITTYRINHKRPNPIKPALGCGRIRIRSLGILPRRHWLPLD